MSEVSGFRRLGKQNTITDSEAFKHDDDSWGEGSDSDGSGSAGEDSQISGMKMLKDSDTNSNSSFGGLSGFSKKSKRRRKTGNRNVSGQLSVAPVNEIIMEDDDEEFESKVIYDVDKKRK